MTEQAFTHLILSLLQIPRIGPKTILKIFQQQEPKNLLSFDGFLCLRIPQIERLINSDELNEATWQNYQQDARILLEKTQQANIKVINYTSKDYPRELLGLKNFPLIVYAKGNLDLLHEPGVAFIGTRRPDDEGYRKAQELAEQFARDGFVVVSGLSIGTNTAAHIGALQASNGKTIAILGQSLEQSVYPPENKQLAQDILAEGGLIISTFSYGTVVRRQFLAARDEWESGLAKGIVVVQTDQNGHDEIALEHARKQHKKIAALDFSRGNFDTQREKVINNMRYIQTGEAFSLWDAQDAYAYEQLMLKSDQTSLF